VCAVRVVVVGVVYRVTELSLIETRPLDDSSEAPGGGVMEYLLVSPGDLMDLAKILLYMLYDFGVGTMNYIFHFSTRYECYLSFLYINQFNIKWYRKER